jgi:serine/threonine protein kinase
MWSLGMVVYLLLAMSLDPNFEGMNRMSQDQLRDFLSKNLSDLDHEVSYNAKNFLWRCLQTMPSMRMTAFDAECHDWLCTPEKHLSFFQELDRRMLRDWKQKDELSPMPFPIPDVGRGSPPSNELTEEGRFSQYFALNLENLSHASELLHAAHLVGTGCGEADTETNVEQSFSRVSEPEVTEAPFTDKLSG